MLPLVVSVLSFHFAYMDRAATTSLLTRWKPQFEGNIFIARVESLKTYIHATRRVRDTSANVCGLVSPDVNLFVVNLEGQRCELCCCLWQPNVVSKIDTLRMLRAWLKKMDYDCVSALKGSDEVEWSLSEFDA